MKINKILAKQIGMTIMTIGFLGYVGYNGYMKNKEESAETDTNTNATEAKAVLVSTHIVKEFPVTTKKAEILPIAASNTGSIKRLFVSNGQQVQKGDLLVSIVGGKPSESILAQKAESISYIKSLKNVLAQLDADESTRDPENNTIEELQQRRKNVVEALARAEVNHNMLTSQLEATNIYAPANGIIQEISIDMESARVEQGATLMKIKLFQSKEVTFTVTNNEYRFLLDYIANSTAVLLNQDKEQLPILASEISSIKSTGLDENDNISLRVGVKSFYSAFKAQTIKWNFNTVTLLSIPYNALVIEDKDYFVWKITPEGQKEKVQVDIIQNDGKTVYVRKGLKEGDLLQIHSNRQD